MKGRNTNVYTHTCLTVLLTIYWPKPLGYQLSTGTKSMVIQKT